MYSGFLIHCSTMQQQESELAQNGEEKASELADMRLKWMVPYRNKLYAIFSLAIELARDILYSGDGRFIFSRYVDHEMTIDPRLMELVDWDQETEMVVGCETDKSETYVSQVIFPGLQSRGLHPHMTMKARVTCRRRLLQAPSEL